MMSDGQARLSGQTDGRTLKRFFRIRPREIPILIAMAVVLTGFLYVFISNARDYPPDVRFYGTWDVFVGPPESPRHCTTWMLTPPWLFNGTLSYGNSQDSVDWGVSGGQFFDHVGRRDGPVGYQIVEVTDARIVLTKDQNGQRLELRRLQ